MEQTANRPPSNSASSWDTHTARLPRSSQRIGRPRAAVDLPVDRDLGLCGGFSLGVVNAMTRLCTQMAFASARETFGNTQEWTPSPRATLRMVDAAGAQARAFLEQSPAPADDDGDVLVLQVDGKGAPMISTVEHERRQTPHRFPHVPGRKARRLRRRVNPRKRRTSGKKSKNAKISFVGVIYGLKRTPRGVEGPIGKRLMATFDSHEELVASVPVRYRAVLHDLEPVKHVLTHKDLHLHPVQLLLPSSARIGAQGQWFDADQLPDLGLPAPVRVLLQA